MARQRKKLAKIQKNLKIFRKNEEKQVQPNDLSQKALWCSIAAYGRVVRAAWRLKEKSPASMDALFDLADTIHLEILGQMYNQIDENGLKEIIEKNGERRKN